MARAVLLSFLYATVVSSLQYTGYVVDNYCWNKPNHRGIDNSLLGTAPETHVLHCLIIPACITNGFALLEALPAPAADGSTYGIRYQLDAAGDALVVKMVNAEMTRGGDRDLGEQLTLSGTLNGAGELAVTELCHTPSNSNTANMKYCYTAAGNTTTPNTAPIPATTGCASPDPQYEGYTFLTGDSTTGIELHWKVESPSVSMKVIRRGSGTSNGWLSVAAAPTAVMVGGDAVVGQASGVAQYSLNGKATSQVILLQPQSLSNTAYSATSTSATLTFSRPLAGGAGGVDIKASGSNVFLWAWGSGALGYHTERGSVQLDLTSCSATSITVDNSKYTTHGWLMTVAWGILLPAGALLASATRGGDAALITVPHWPLIHMAIQCSGVVLMTAGFAMSYVATEDAKSEHFKDTHQKVGLFLFIAGWVQVLFGVVRPKNDPAEESLLHKLWSWKHRLLGMGSLGLAIWNIYTGMDKPQVNVEDALKATFTAWCALLGTALLAIYAWKGAISRSTTYKNGCVFSVDDKSSADDMMFADACGHPGKANSLGDQSSRPTGVELTSRGCNPDRVC